MGTRNRFLFFTICLIAALFFMNRVLSTQGQKLPAGHVRFGITSENRHREFALFVPSKYEKSNPLPLVVMLHGMGGTAANAINETHWSVRAEVDSFIVAYPEATRPDPSAPPSLRKNPQAWNDGSGRFHASEEHIDDVGFIAKMLDRIESDYSIDPKRIFVTGFSNGASMTFRIGAELTARIAAIAPSAGACWTKELKLTESISVCYVTGDADKLNPMDGGFPKLAWGGKAQGGKEKPPVQDTIDKWVNALGCTSMPVIDTEQDGVRTRRYESGVNGAEVKYITVEGLGHHWAGGTNQAPEFLVGKHSKKLNATDVIWAFFLSHPKP